MNRSKYRSDCVLEWAQGTVYSMGARIPSAQGKQAILGRPLRCGLSSKFFGQLLVQCSMVGVQTAKTTASGAATLTVNSDVWRTLLATALTVVCLITVHHL